MSRKTQRASFFPKRVRSPTPDTAPSSVPPTQRGRRASRKKKEPQRQVSLWGDQSTATCTELQCDYWHPPECHFFEKKKNQNRPENSAKIVRSHIGKRMSDKIKKKKNEKGWRQKCSERHSRQNQKCLAKFNTTRTGKPGAWTNCKTSAVSRKSTKELVPNRRVRLTRATLR